MKALIASAFVLAMLAPTVANAAITIGIATHPSHVRDVHHHRRQVCSFHHRHRVCFWR